MLTSPVARTPAIESVQTIIARTLDSFGPPGGGSTQGETGTRPCQPGEEGNRRGPVLERCGWVLHETVHAPRSTGGEPGSANAGTGEKVVCDGL